MEINKFSTRILELEYEKINISNKMIIFISYI